MTSAASWFPSPAKRPCPHRPAGPRATSGRCKRWWGALCRGAPSLGDTVLPRWEKAQEQGQTSGRASHGGGPCPGVSPKALALRNPLGDTHERSSYFGGSEVFAGPSPAGLNPPYSQRQCRKPRPCLSLSKRGRMGAGARQPRPAAAAHASSGPGPAVEGDAGQSQAVSGAARWEQPARHGARRGPRQPRSQRQHQRRGCSAHVPETAAFSRTAQLQPPASKCLGDDSQAHRPLPDRRHRPPPAARLGARFGGVRSRPRDLGVAGGAVLTSRAVLPHAALPRLQQRRAVGPFLPGGPQHLPDPRLHTPLAAAGLALVGAGAPLAPRPRLTRLCGGQGCRMGTVSTQHQARPQAPRARGVGTAYLGTRGCRAAPQCWGGTAENTGPCASKTCLCTSCRSLC